MKLFKTLISSLLTAAICMLPAYAVTYDESESINAAGFPQFMIRDGGMPSATQAPLRQWWGYSNTGSGNPSQAGFSTSGYVAIQGNSGSSVSYTNLSSGYYALCTTGTASGDYCGQISGGGFALRGGTTEYPYFIHQIRTGPNATDVTNVAIYAGVNDTTGSGTYGSNPLPIYNCVLGFIYENGSSGGGGGNPYPTNNNWWVIYKTGLSGYAGIFDTGVPVTYNTDYTLCIDDRTGVPAAYINGQYVGSAPSSAANYPYSGILAPAAVATAFSSTAENLYVKSVYVSWQ